MGVAFDTGWAIIKEAPFFECPSCNLKDEYHNSRDGSIFCRGCGRYFIADLDGKWKEYDRDGDLGSLVKAPWYYHATPEENVMPILREGIKGGFGGEVYASKDPDLARRWISFTNRGSPRVATIPFWRDEDDPRMSPGMDHSPMMIDMLMGPDYEGHEGGSVVSNETIPPEDLLPNMEARGTPSNEDRSAGNPGIEIYDNPMYSEQWGEMMAQLRIAQEKAEREWRERNNG